MKITVVGLGYVGLPIAISFAKKYHTYGFDINKSKIEKYKNNIDITEEVGVEEIKHSKLHFTNDPTVIKKCDFIIVAVPTPIDNKNEPDLKFLINATKMISFNLKSGSTIVYESTVYPGTTEEVCIPIIEKITGFKCNKDFFVGYSPERINPGDKLHTFENIKKIVSGSNSETTERISKLYEKCLVEKPIKVSCIKVAEASKIIENAQRDINIAFINEVSKIFHIMGIDTNEVLEAASTKWNFLNFKPGLVGGHCIGVDPYYLSYKARQLGFNSQVILSGRITNDSMGDYIADNIKRELVKKHIRFESAKVLIKGLTFKENINDIRNSKVIDIINNLKNSKIQVYLEDSHVNNGELHEMYGLFLSESIPKVDVVVFAVKHSEYYKISINELENYYNREIKILFDIHCIFDKEKLLKRGFDIWRL